MAVDGALHLLADQVVGQQRVVAVGAPIEDVEDVFAVGGLDGAHELEVGDGLVEDLVVAVLEVEAAGEDDPVVLGELDAGAPDGVDPPHVVVARVEDQVAPPLLAVRLDAQQDEGADGGVLELRVVERLVGVVDGLRVDAGAVRRVVLDLDREVTADGLDEDGVEDVDVGVVAGHLGLAARDPPLEVVGGREGVVALPATVDVPQPAGVASPAKDLDVLVAGADLEDRQQLRVAASELKQGGVAVVAIDLAKVALEVVAPQVGDLLGWHVLEVSALVGESMGAEDVGDGRLLLQPHVHVEAEQQVAVDLHDVAGDAVVLGPNAPVGEDRELGPAEGLLAPLVECLGLLAQRAPVGEKPLTNHLVAAALEGRV